MLRTLRFTTLCLPLTSLLLLAGCGGEDPVADDEAGDSETDTSTETAETEVGTDDTTTTTDDETTETTADDTTDGPSETADETTGDESTDGPEETTGTPEECAPEPNDTECTSCLKDNCCDEVSECYADEDCGCMADCIQDGGDPLSCAQECQVMGIPPALQQLGACTMSECGPECGL